MAVVLRYVDKKGCVIECFLGLKHVPNTSAMSLKKALEELFSSHGLSMAKLRGQGYDGASNMQGEFNGLKTLIMNDNPHAYFIHCFAHQLQLALVGLARHHLKVGDFFNMVSMVANVVGASCKRRDILIDKQAERIKNALRIGELKSGKGLNQETNLKRLGDTRWGSHYGSLLNLIGMFGSVLDVIETVKADGTLVDQRIHALAIYESIQSFEFIFILHLMKNILGITNDLSQALQKRDQNIVNAMSLVKVSKQRLQMMRDDGWDSLLDDVSSFCNKHDIIVPKMEDKRILSGRPRRNVQDLTYLHHYRISLFCTVIDLQRGELDDRFNETNTELLLCLACLSPCDSFHNFDKVKLIRLAHFYPKEFSKIDLLQLADQLDNYIIDMKSSLDFSELTGIDDLSVKLVVSKKNQDYVLVYKLITLALILPVATASVERVFSAMKIVKNDLRNRIGDEWMNNCLIVYAERDIFRKIDNEDIIQYFQNMANRRGQL